MYSYACTGYLYTKILGQGYILTPTVGVSNRHKGATATDSLSVRATNKLFPLTCSVTLPLINVHMASMASVMTIMYCLEFQVFYLLYHTKHCHVLYSITRETIGTCNDTSICTCTVSIVSMVTMLEGRENALCDNRVPYVKLSLQ